MAKYTSEKQLKIGRSYVAEDKFKTDLIYQLNDKPPFFASLIAAFQHMLSIFVSIILPPIIICSALGVDIKNTSYIVSMSLLISGVATFIQCHTFGPVGSGLLSIQGTSFSFLGPVIASGTAVIAAGGTPETALATVFSVCILGAFIEVGISRVFHLARRIITPIVTGTVVTLIGMTLIKVGMDSICGGEAAKATGTYGSLENILLAMITLVIIIICNLSKNNLLRMSSIFIGILGGFIVSMFMGRIDLSKLQDLDLLAVPVPFKYGFDFSWEAFVPIAFVFVITAIETIGDLTATSAVSGQPVEGDRYVKRIKAGILGDGVNSLIAAVFNTFPNTTFSQNNGVIQLTGVAARRVGYYIAALLILAGLFPIVGGIFQLLPPPVLGGATVIMFGTIATSGIRILSTLNVDKRGILIVATSFSLGFGVTYVPEVLSGLPKICQIIFASGFTTGGLTAILLNIILPGRGADNN